jgi:hypothetical protein
MLPSTPTSFTLSLSFWFHKQNPMCVAIPPRVCHFSIVTLITRTFQFHIQLIISMPLIIISIPLRYQGSTFYQYTIPFYQYTTPYYQYASYYQHATHFKCTADYQHTAPPLISPSKICKMHCNVKRRVCIYFYIGKCFKQAFTGLCKIVWAFTFEVFALVGYCLASVSSWLPTFRDSLSVPSKNVKEAMRNCLTRESGTDRLSRNVVTNY